MGEQSAGTDIVRTPLRAAFQATRAAARGELPKRYSEMWHGEYTRRVDACLRPGMSILDVGAGRHPTIPPERRPSSSRYVGLDLSQAELDRAPAHWYDEKITADVTDRVARLEQSFDLVISYLVLEHVADLPRAFENVRSYLVPGGRFVAFFAGTFSAFGLANRVLPQSVAQRALGKLLHRPRDSVFPAYYHRCWASAIERSLATWSTVDVVCMWYGADYLRFFRPAQAIYVGYEEWARHAGHRNLAPYYLVDATA